MVQAPKVLILSTVWPEPKSSAAGVRQMQWVEFFRRQNGQIYLSSPAKMKSEEDWGALELPSQVHLLPLPLNQSRVKDDLRALQPDIVVFDQFILEEQFGHLIYEACPQALVILETEDLRFVRRAREEVKDRFLELEALPPKFYQTETALRETASILRADYAFVISSFEERLLQEEFGIGESQVKWIPFSFEPISPSALSFEERNGFVWIGNFRHAPNIDGIRWFRKEIWPLIRKKLPTAKLQIYGAYPTKEVSEWHQPQQGIEVKGSVDQLETVFDSARVNLAPLRFGAGIKGKILEGFRRGVPCVTTMVGAEGMEPLETSNFTFQHMEANTPQAFAETCVRLHEQKKNWEEARAAGNRLIQEVQSEAANEKMLKYLFESLYAKKKSGDLPHWQSKILRHELMNSHKYFAMWIEAKGRSRSE